MQNQTIEIAGEPEAKDERADFYAAIPANGSCCPHTGLKHGHLYKLLGEEGDARAYVRVVNLKNPKARHGKTLFHVGDMLRFFDQKAFEQGTGTKRNERHVPAN